MISIILTVHNKQELVEMVLCSIVSNVSQLTKEIIVVLDGCTDRSETIVKNSPGVTKILYAPDVFEVRANNIGLREANENYCMIIQDDMVIQQKHFDAAMVSPFQFRDTFAVSARTAHDNIAVGDIIHHINISGRETGLSKGIYSIRDSCNRGPLLLKHDALEKLNYLDEDFAPLHLDDHDLCMRAYRDLGMVSGSYVIDYRSDIDWGSTRNPNIAVLSNDSWHKNSRIMTERHKEALSGEKHGEERQCL